jgi:hypothetical protein
MRTLRFLGRTVANLAIMGLVTATTIQHDWRRYRAR